MSKRQITDLPVATQVDDVDIAWVRQGPFDVQAKVDFLREPLLRKSNNLSDLDDPSAARVNLGVDTTDFLQVTNNLSDLDDPSAARLNLGVDTTDFLQVTNNLSDVDNAGTARFNLDVPSNSEALLGANNLSDVGSAATARTNLDVVSATITAVTNDDNNYDFNQQRKMQLREYSETVTQAGNITGTHTFNLQDSNVFTATVTGDVTISFSNQPASGQLGSIFLILTNGGGSVITWPAAVIWNEGTAPELTETGTDLLVFTTPDNGTTWYGALAGKDMS